MWIHDPVSHGCKTWEKMGQGNASLDQSLEHLLIDNNEEKNPKNVDGETPLHYAAKHTFGVLEICQLIIDKVIDKNPRDECGTTLITLLSVRKYIASTTDSAHRTGLIIEW